MAVGVGNEVGNERVAADVASAIESPLVYGKFMKE